MIFGYLKQYMPRGLYGRAALILLLPIVTLQLAVSVAFIQRYFEDVTRQMTRALVDELQLAAGRAATSPEEAQALAGALQLRLSFDPEPLQGNARALYDLSGRTVLAVLDERLPGFAAAELLPGGPVRIQMTAPAGGQARLLEFDVPRGRMTASNPHQLLVIVVVLGALMALIAFLFLRNQLRPITRLAAAAEAFGRGRHKPYKPSGAAEVRAAGNAFLDMRARIERQIEQRTMMLSGVSHDLRTPLTRFKLNLSMLDPAEAGPLRQDVAEMEQMLDAFLAFARGDALDDPVPTDPAALLRDVVARMQGAGGQVELDEITGEGLVRLRPLAITRALENLISNALRYGTRAEAGMHLTGRTLRFRIEDDGPGIPEAQREEALKPFVRLDAARNQDSGSGVGLGLAITQDIARRHGGTLRLGRSARLGGLEVDLVLPV